MSQFAASLCIIVAIASGASANFTSHTGAKFLWPNPVSIIIKQALKEMAKKHFDDEESKMSKIFDKMLPECLQDGQTVLSCFDKKRQTEQKTVEEYTHAAKAAIDKFKTSDSASKIIKMAKEAVTGAICNAHDEIPILDKVDMVKKITLKKKKETCKTQSDPADHRPKLRQMKHDFLSTWEEVFNAAASTMPSFQRPNCVCSANFALYFGAGVQVSAYTSGELSRGIVVGCKNCQVYIDFWYSWFAGVTSNMGGSVGLVAGVTRDWNSFWGGSWCSAVSLGPNVYSAAVGVCMSIPDVDIKTERVRIKRDFCKTGICESFERSVVKPLVVKWNPAPELLGIEIAMSAGVSLLPVDATTGYSHVYDLIGQPIQSWR